MPNNMSNSVINTIILATSFLALFGVAEMFYHLRKVRVEFTRKLVHVGTGLLTLLFPVMLSNHWWVLLLCVSFAMILVISMKCNLLQSINAIERKSFGSITYPIAVYACYLFFDGYNHRYIYFYLPILILAICDPIAALTGKKWPIGKYKCGQGNKTISGSGMFFMSAFILVLLLFTLLEKEVALSNILFAGIVIASISALVEALSRNGYDNITIPAIVLICLIAIEYLC
jgi:phytol kinase